MRNDNKVEEESLFAQALVDNKTNKEKEIKLKKSNTKPFTDVRQLLFPNYNVDSTVDLSRHPPLKLCQKECNSHEPMWVREHDTSLATKIKDK